MPSERQTDFPDYEATGPNMLAAAVAAHGDVELVVLDDSPGENLRSQVEEAVRRCPRQALSVEG